MEHDGSRRLRPKHAFGGGTDVERIRTAIARLENTTGRVRVLWGAAALLLLGAYYLVEGPVRYVFIGASILVAGVANLLQANYADWALRRVPDTPRAVGLLAEALERQDGTTAEKLKEVLVPRLERMGPDGFETLSLDERRSLYHLMVRSTRSGPYKLGRSESEVHLQMRIVEMLAACGGEDALWNLQRAAKSADTDRVRNAAEGACTAVRERLGIPEPNYDLLRPADPPPGEGLLRPAQAVSETEPEQLLRPASGESPH